MPTVRLPLAVFKCKCKDGIAFLYGVLSLRVIGLQGAVDSIEGGGGRK